jgi:restriction system protein
MSRRRHTGGGAADDAADVVVLLTSQLPWWIGLSLAAISYLVLHYFAVTSEVELGDVKSALLRPLLMLLQYVIPFLFVIGAGKSIMNAVRGRELLRSAAARDAAQVVAEMHWQDFERLMGAWFQTQGYAVTQAGGANADGGVDIELRRGGELYLVQCKHYRTWKVAVDVIRDLYGVMTAKGASGGFVVTSGQFTEPAKEFAEGRAITLMDGDALARVLAATAPRADGSVASPQAAPSCPSCGNPMVRRVARQGSHAGKDFWGCSRFPDCKGTRSITV